MLLAGDRLVLYCSGDGSGDAKTPDVVTPLVGLNLGHTPPLGLHHPRTGDISQRDNCNLFAHTNPPARLSPPVADGIGCPGWSC